MTHLHLSARHSTRADVAAGDSADWRAKAACRTEDPELFFPVGTSAAALLQAEKAKRVCRRCPVLARCRQWGDTIGQNDGVYGGTSEQDRHDRARAGEELALTHGLDVIQARLDGTTESVLAQRFRVTLPAVRYALRLLLPQAGASRRIMTNLERLVACDEEKLRLRIRTGMTDMRIALSMGYAMNVIAAARVILAHRDAARGSLSTVPLRDRVPDEAPVADGDAVDEVTVEAYLQGRPVPLTVAERVEAVARAVQRGMTYRDIDALHRLKRNSTSTFMSRTRKRYQAASKAFPVLEHPSGARVDFSDEQVVSIREEAAKGASLSKLALRYGVHRNAIGNVVRGKTYPHVGGPVRGQDLGAAGGGSGTRAALADAA